MVDWFCSCQQVSKTRSFFVLFFSFFSLNTFSLRLFQKLQITDENFWHNLWNSFIDKYGKNEEFFVVYITTLYSISLYWIFGIIFFAFNFIPGFKKFRHQENKPIDVRKMIYASLFQVSFSLYLKFFLFFRH